MAQRRMFSKKITETDMFLDMPMSTQCLYFHLNMSADDDGFIGNVKTVKRMIGASDDDLKVLMSKEFIIPFESGVVVIKDWKIHNYIQKDRYNKTIYEDEKKQLEENENKQYQMLEPMYPECIQNESSPDTQVRLGKDRLGKVSQGKDRLGEVSSDTEQEQKQTDPSADAISFYQDNFGLLNPIMMQTIDHWVDDIGEELVIEAMRRAATDQKGFRYAEGIMRNWDKKNIRTMEQVEAEDVAFNNRKNTKQYNKPPVREEKLPEWARDDAKPVEETPIDDKAEEEFQERLKRIRELQK